MEKQTILFVYVNYSSFVKADHEILSTFANVTKYRFKPGKGILNTAAMLVKQFLFLLVNIWKFDAVFIWFADFHSLLPVIFAKMFGKNSFVVIGGYEVGRIRNLNYGVLCSKIRGFFCINSMRLCTINFTVSNYIDRKVKFIVPRSNRKLVPNCVDYVQKMCAPSERENLVLTVGIIENQRTLFLKGIDTFIEIARYCPDYKFIIVGLDEQKLSAFLTNIPDNVTILGRLSHDDLPTYYKKSKFYLQLSRSESFGVSVAEAMFYGCIPIVTNEGGLPELVGGNGFIVKRVPINICKLINENSLISHELQIECFKRIAFCFSRAKREEKLYKSIFQTTKEN